MLTEFNETPKLKGLLKSVDALKSEVILKWRVDNSASLSELLRVKITYSSNALEGSTLSEYELAKFIETGITIDGKPFRDYQEAKGHDEALKLSYQMAKKDHTLHVNDLKVFFIIQILTGLRHFTKGFFYMKIVLENTRKTPISHTPKC
jgi:Fic family protein